MPGLARQRNAGSRRSENEAPFDSSPGDADRKPGKREPRKRSFVPLVGLRVQTTPLESDSAKEICLIIYSDSGWWVQAPPAPAKQFDYEGIGTFATMRAICRRSLPTWFATSHVTGSRCTARNSVSRATNFIFVALGFLNQRKARHDHRLPPRSRTSRRPTSLVAMQTSHLERTVS